MYAAGYKFSGGFKVQKTGSLIINSNPRGARILINNKVQQNIFKKIFSSGGGYITTPAKIKNLSPEEYTVEINLKDYLPWKKKLTINPGQSTFAEDINLFKDNLPLLMMPKTEINSTISPNNKRLITINDENEIIFIDIDSETEKILKTENKILTDSIIRWSENSKKIIINNEIFDLNNPENPISLNKIIGKNIDDIKWDINNDNKIFYKDKNTLNYYNFNNHTNKIIFKNDFLKDYIAKNETIFFIENQKDNSLLKIYNIDEAREVNQISLPLSDYSFINYGHKLINLYDPKHKILYLIDPYDNFKPLRETINNITKTYWADDTRLLYTNDFEVWIFNLKNLQKKLLTRISQKIDNIIWHPSNNNIIYSTNKNINVIELDDREKYNITKIIELDGITNTVLNKKGDTLYFYAQIGNQKGLYKLLIQ
ncbi:hypothetical protein A2331_06410 [Candidatus Falkowbacteria bacterium RIFOXYB2_FULL_34_18]|uniref:PEGA domain-containing protein n=1 Tax=Candidatus Falkowbacteria bacterium RIFOXYD2_FULL_34_120 TaxID=1798007 RepID=A0A1F5TQC7_9BACT|nr:MAG: hypothetical protein A2331_06410 [Candidatus Falkowbacteria bacterium RIFOXYB2_FULL_34_18]OGF29401.1 MAG: hypothetical protein A2500_06500 [Candidatus Falkowbacteria bacterium RIFOXYC12_FULL_34_55]OGF36610.1 MAG: hypothetical protein A2466_06835 [Candidatus Falkowbacteria bacterium RIFOXYC2_FULL_34_220]OGF38828.1 MAG: hypothetical protein A2515_03280 [Candidatus Falkowbacteria bacterium RIFOXYD12_FULL_34_57]OGF41067.1 MAG: hypothetical protein A2531_03215 [Candidatus Falkowbacteria bact